MSIPNETVVKQYSFKRGWGKVPNKLTKTVRLEIMELLDINRSNFYNRLNGDVEPRVSEAANIEKIFLNHGITDIWGE